MKGLVFGAGNIGRGFLGLLLSKSGYEVTFVDTDAVKVSAIEASRAYPVFTVSKDGIVEDIVTHVSAIYSQNEMSIESAIVEADVILTAVGKDALRHLAPTLARGLIRRMRERPRDVVHVAVVACENIQDNTSMLRDLIVQFVSDDMKGQLTAMISFPNCVVDRIVPNTLPRASDSPLAVAVEEYFQLAIDGHDLRGAFPSIAGIDVVSSLRATLEQKLCTLNMAHAIVGYFGHLRGYQFVHEAVADRDIAELLQGALQEVASLMVARHGSITADQQQKYGTSVVDRFKNAYLRDEITRVARQPRRKLGREDRLIKPALLSTEQGSIPAFLVSGITAALHYNFAGDAEAQELVRNVRASGVERVFEQVSGIAPQSDLGRLIISDYLLRAL